MKLAPLFLLLLAALYDARQHAPSHGYVYGSEENQVSWVPCKGCEEESANFEPIEATYIRTKRTGSSLSPTESIVKTIGEKFAEKHCYTPTTGNGRIFDTTTGFATHRTDIISKISSALDPDLGPYAKPIRKGGGLPSKHSYLLPTNNQDLSAGSQIEFVKNPTTEKYESRDAFYMTKLERQSNSNLYNFLGIEKKKILLPDYLVAEPGHELDHFLADPTEAYVDDSGLEGPEMNAELDKQFMLRDQQKTANKANRPAKKPNRGNPHGQDRPGIPAVKPTNTDTTMDTSNRKMLNNCANKKNKKNKNKGKHCAPNKHKYDKDDDAESVRHEAVDDVLDHKEDGKNEYDVDVDDNGAGD